MPFTKERHRVTEPIPAFLFLMRHFGVSQAEAQRIICKERLLVGGKPVTPGTRLDIGEVELIRFVPAPRGKTPLLATEDFAVFDKPSGILVHPNKTETPYSMLDDIRYLYGDEANAVHRIDKETSGLLLVSRHKAAERFLKNAFETKAIAKSYLAWVEGRVASAFTVDAPIKINDDYRTTKHKVFIDSTGKPAITKFRPIFYDKALDATLLACYPETGRTHQIRIHLFHVKHPILGDPIYHADYTTANAYLDGKLGNEERRMRTGASRLMLHAQTLSFRYKNDVYVESAEDFASQKNLICATRVREFEA